MPSKIAIGVKYCGGCNPDYNRVQAISKLAKELNNIATFQDYRTSDIDLYLLVAGCQTACVEAPEIEDAPIYTVTSAEEIHRFKEWILDKIP